MKDQHKHVMFVYDSLRIGGCERVITVLAKEFLAKGYRVTIFLIKKNIIEYDLPKDVEIITFQDYPDRLLLERHGLPICLDAKGAELMGMLPRRDTRDTERLDAAKGLINELKAEIASLREELSYYRSPKFQMKLHKIEKENGDLRDKLRVYNAIIDRYDLGRFFGKNRDMGHSKKAAQHER